MSALFLFMVLFHGTDSFLGTGDLGSPDFLVNAAIGVIALAFIKLCHTKPTGFNEEYLDYRMFGFVTNARLAHIENMQIKALCGVAKYAFGGSAEPDPFVKQRDLVKDNYLKKEGISHLKEIKE